MNPHNAIESKRAELISVATSMLGGNINLIEGVRKICTLRHAVGDPDNEVFMPFRAIESETDHFPLGQMRECCAKDYLQRMDNEMQRYIVDAKNDILIACRKIIQIFS
jgi:hypothetical protein